MALFGHGTMCDVSPLCAPKRTSAIDVLSARATRSLAVLGASLRVRQTDPTGKSPGDCQNPLSSPFDKNISVFPKSKSRYMICHPVPKEGRFAIVTNAGWGAVDADGAFDESA
jgi:hypothetical protein